MTYEDKASIVSRELAGGASLPDALRMADLRRTGRTRRRSRRGPNLSKFLKDEIRRRRAAGDKLEVIAVDLEVSVSQVSYHGQGVTPQRAPEPAPPAIAADVITRACARFGITAEQFWPGCMGKPNKRIVGARWSALLALADHLGLTFVELGRTFGRPPADMIYRVGRARSRSDVVQAAEEIAREVRAAAAEKAAQQEHAA